jgi:WXXGXW repeat (2 copies)
MNFRNAFRSLLFSLIFAVFSGGLSQSAHAQISFGLSVNFGPPALPVYEQPICPADGYLWTPGYWAYDPLYGYYWVPGTWIQPPSVGLLWTPGYWGWGGGGAFFFHQGYWGPHVGFYGGINYGFGYVGTGYFGGRWDGGRFSYNTYVNHVNTTVIHNTYNTTVVNNVTVNRVSYNGGEGGVAARPTAEQTSYAGEHHIPPVAAQTQHVQEAQRNPELRASANHGVPPVAATAKPGDFKTGVVASKEAGGEYKAPAVNPPHDAKEVQPHQYTAANTGNADVDKKNQQQQDQLAASQAQEHQELQQRQEQEHQQAAQKSYNEQQNQQMEEHHAQQTQQLEQKHATEQRQMQQRQAPPPPHESAPREPKR